MTLDVTNFLLSLAAAMAGGVVPNTPTIAQGVNLFVDDVPEGAPGVSEPYSVLRQYGGPPPEEMWHVEKFSIQVETTGKNATAVRRQIRQLFESLYEPATDTDAESDAERVPRNHWQIPAKALIGTAVVDDPNIAGYEIRYVDPKQPPGVVARDEPGRWKAVFNFDLRFQQAAYK